MSYYQAFKTQKHARQIHSCLRASERCRVNIDFDDLKNIIVIIQNNQTFRQKRLTRESTLHSLRYKNSTIHVIYNKSQKCINTVYSDKMAELEYAQEYQCPPR